MIYIILICVLLFIGLLYYMIPDKKLYDFVKWTYRLLSNLKLKEISIDNQKIVYLEANPNSDNIIVLLHGITADKYMWPFFAKKFVKNNYRVIALDLPPFGESTYNDQINYSIENQAKNLKKIVENLGIKNPFHIVGNSMGGGVAGKFTILYPKSIKSLTLIDNMGVYSVKRTKFLENLESGGKNLMLIKTREDLNEMFKLVYHKVPFIPSKIKNVILEEGIKNHDRNKKVFDDLMKEEWYFENELDKINTPTLIMWGEYDEVFDLSSAYLLNKGIKNSKIKIIDNSGHIPMNETPNPTSETVLDFINNIN